MDSMSCLIISDNKKTRLQKITELIKTKNILMEMLGIEPRSLNIHILRRQVESIHPLFKNFISLVLVIANLKYFVNSSHHIFLLRINYLPKFKQNY